MKRSTVSSLSDFEKRYVRPSPGRVLVAGSRIYPGRVDRRTLHADAVGVDLVAGEGVDIVADLEEPFEAGDIAHIECLSVLEHARRPWKLAEQLEQVLPVGGTLFVAAPFAWRIHGYPDDYWRFTASGIRSLFPRIEWSRLMYAGKQLRDQPKVYRTDGGRFFERMEVCGFGVRA